MLQVLTSAISQWRQHLKSFVCLLQHRPEQPSARPILHIFSPRFDGLKAVDDPQVSASELLQIFIIFIKTVYKMFVYTLLFCGCS